MPPPAAPGAGGRPGAGYLPRWSSFIFSARPSGGRSSACLLRASLGPEKEKNCACACACSDLPSSSTSAHPRTHTTLLPSNSLTGTPATLDTRRPRPSRGAATAARLVLVVAAACVSQALARSDLDACLSLLRAWSCRASAHASTFCLLHFRLADHRALSSSSCPWPSALRGTHPACSGAVPEVSPARRRRRPRLARLHRVPLPSTQHSHRACSIDLFGHSPLCLAVLCICELYGPCRGFLPASIRLDPPSLHPSPGAFALALQTLVICASTKRAFTACVHYTLFVPRACLNRLCALLTVFPPAFGRLTSPSVPRLRASFSTHSRAGLRRDAFVETSTLASTHPSCTSLLLRSIRR